MLSVLSQRARLVAIGTVGAIAAFFVFGGARTGTSGGEPFDAAPRDSFLVATVNLAELRRSPLHDVLFGKDPSGRGPRSEVSMLGAKALGIGKLADACGFDPLGRVEQLAVAVPEEGDKGELGMAARVTVTRDELSTCTSNLAGQRGGKVATKDVGSFVVVEDSAGSQEAARPRLAYGRGGLLVVGRGAWFDAMLGAADGKQPGAREAQAHMAMRSSLTSRDGWRSPTVLISALLPRSLRDRLKSEMAAEVSADGTAADTSQSIMSGVLGVSGVGLALRAGSSGQSIDVALQLVCDSEDGCAAVEKLILKKRLDWSKELTLRMVGFGPLLDSIEVKRERARIRVTAGAAADALASTIDRVLRLKARSQDGDDSPGHARPVAPAPLPPSEKTGQKSDQKSDHETDKSDTKAGPRPDETIPAPRASH